MFPKQVTSILERAVDAPDTTPPMFFWGPPGIGKSAIPKQVAHDKKIGFVDLRGPLLDPTDLRGIPTVLGDKAKWLPPSFLPTEGKGILFLDELASAPPLVQASMYQLTLDRAIGEYTLPDGWYIIAAGNRIEDRSVSYRMPTALANRFTHVNFEVNLDDWIDWAARVGHVNPNIIGFIRFKPDMLWAFNPESSEKAFASPRSWDFASRMIKVAPTKLLPEILNGTVGTGCTSEFMAFLKIQTELPPIDDILNGLDFVPPKGRMDLRYAMISALATRAKTEKIEKGKTVPDTTHFTRLIDFSESMEAEFGVLLVTMLIGKDQGLLLSCPNIDKWARCHSDVIVNKKELV